jgi:serine/threonine protein kinase
MPPPDRLHEIEELFHAARELDPARRDEFLTRCDPQLRAEVEALLAAHDQSASFVDAPAWHGAAELLSEEPTKTMKTLAGRVIGHYRIESQLGKGGMGEVWLATDTLLNRRVAIKILPEEFTRDRDLIHRFEREARAASALNHPNILTIHEIGAEGDLHFIATEFIEGETLRQRLNRGPLPVDEAVELIIQATAALAAAHQAGIIHRDIKPENLMLRPDGYLKVLDFGLARISKPDQPATSENTPHEQTTQPGMILGTLSYMSPEQARGLKVDERTDIWSVGVILYEMLAGQRPFSGATTGDIFVSILDREPPPLTQSRPQIPAELEYIVTKALNKNREERYQTIQQMNHDLKELRRSSGVISDHNFPLTPTLTSEEPTLVIENKQTSKGALAPELQTFPDGHIIQPTKKSSRASLSLIGVSLLAILVAAFFSSRWFSPAPLNPASSPASLSSALSERSLTWWLTVQRTRDGRDYQQPFESSGQNEYESGYKFRFNFTSPQSGFLYLLNEGPAADGAVTLNHLFPTPANNNGAAFVNQNQIIQTGWNYFDIHPGTEKFRLVWSAQAVNELEAVKVFANPKDKGTISDPAKLKAVQDFLARSEATKPDVRTDDAAERTYVTGKGETLVSLINLKHR